MHVRAADRRPTLPAPSLCGWRRARTSGRSRCVSRSRRCAAARSSCSRSSRPSSWCCGRSRCSAASSSCSCWPGCSRSPWSRRSRGSSNRGMRRGARHRASWGSLVVAASVVFLTVFGEPVLHPARRARDAAARLHRADASTWLNSTFRLNLDVTKILDAAADLPRDDRRGGQQPRRRHLRGGRDHLRRSSSTASPCWCSRSTSRPTARACAAPSVRGCRCGTRRSSSRCGTSRSRRPAASWSRRSCSPRCRPSSTAASST